MTTDQSIIPITDEQAKAIQEIAKALGIGLETVQKFGGFMDQVIGTPLKDFVGLTIGDSLKAKRLENMIRIAEKVRERLAGRNINEPQPVSLIIAKPLLDAAADESREQLQDLWARLLANAMDPSKANSIRQEFVDAVKRLDPIDAIVLEKFYTTTGELKPSIEGFMSNAFGVSTDTISVSLNNLERIGCIAKNPLGLYLLIAFGRELMKACAP